MRTLLILLISILTITVSQGQNRYYLIAPVDSVAPALVISAQTVGNPAARYNLALDTAIVKMDIALAPAWAGLAYTREEARVIVQQPSWTTDNPEPIDSERRIDLARERGKQITNAWFARIDRRIANNTWTYPQGANAYLNYQDMFGLIEQGVFTIVIEFINTGTITPQGVVTQQMLDDLKDKLVRWEQDHPRP